jgi:hypothetical protein
LKASDGCHKTQIQFEPQTPGRKPKSSSTARLAEPGLCGYIARMTGLTKQEILVLSIIAGLLLTGWCVKYYRDTHPPAAVPALKT